MNSHWILPEPQPATASELAHACGVDPLVAQCLLNRGLSDPVAAAAFLTPRLAALSDPFLIPGLPEAVELLRALRQRGGRLVLFGDYDVDGVTSTAILSLVFSHLGWTVSCFLPNRFDEGYGLTREAAETCLREHRPDLLLAVDCGTTSVSTVAWIREQGVEVVVVDHHQAGEVLPAASALINPRLGGESFPMANLCSAGLAFKLAHGLVKRGRALGESAEAAFDIRELLDLVALGTVADLVPLAGENRILVSAGLAKYQGRLRAGLQALRDVAQIQGEIGVFELGFQFGPRLNAAGRLESARSALDLVLTRDPVLATRLASDLDAQNRERQRIERGMATAAIDGLRTRFDPDRDFALVEARPEWHIGVVGIVASRIVRTFHRPTLVLGGDGGVFRGSGRSIEGFDLAEALRECTDLLLRHGGHAMAAGITLDPTNLDGFRERLNSLARQRLTPDLLRPRLRLDSVVPLADLTLDRVRQLESIQPTGQGNPPVRLCCLRLELEKPVQRMGREKSHARFTVRQGRATAEVVWWNVDGAEPARGPIDLAFIPGINVFNGRTSVQLRLVEWRASTT